MYRKLLVPLDGSKLGEVSFPFAKELAGRLNLATTFLHVAAPEKRQSAPMHRTYVEWAANTIKRQSEEAGRPIEAQGEVVVGQLAAEEILGYARENNIDLILMATRGRWELGSVADRILRTSHIPIWLVRDGPPAEISYDKWPKITIVVPLDGSRLAEGILPHVEAMVKQRGTDIVEVILIRVCEAPAIPSDYPEDMPLSWEEHVEQEVAGCQVDSKQYLSGLEKRLSQAGIKVKRQTMVGRVANEIVDFAAKTPFSFIAMSTHGRSGIGRWVYGSVAERVLVGASSPIFLVRPH